VYKYENRTTWLWNNLPLKETIRTDKGMSVREAVQIQINAPLDESLFTLPSYIQARSMPAAARPSY
jgi:hypothetical protein